MSSPLRAAPIPAVLVLAAGLAMPAVAPAEELNTYNGAQLYKRFCASCHGLDGAGDGPVAATLKLRLPDLAGILARQGGQFPEEKLRRILDGRDVVAAHGGRDMPVWGAELKQAGADPDVLIARLLGQLRAMQKPGHR